MAIFGPIWTQFRSKQLKIQPGSHFFSRVDPIESIRLEMASWSNFKLFRPKLSPNRTKNGDPKAMRKDIISGFSCFAEDDTIFFHIQI